MNTHSLSLRTLQLGIGLVTMLWVLTACQKTDKIPKIIPKSDILNINFELPNKKYQLGSVRYRDLLDELICEKGNSKQEVILNQVNICKDIYEGGRRHIAMQETTRLLSEITRKESNSLDSLIAAEALYVLARTFFYSKGATFEPANGLIFQAMNLSSELIHSSDSLTQIVALFQLAREHDVWQGLTNRYGGFVKTLSKEEWTYASSIALKIKKEYLGLKGPALMRSLSNLMIDYTQLMKHGVSNLTQEKQRILRMGLDEIDNMKRVEVKEYGEFISSLILTQIQQAISDGREDLASKYLTKWIRMQTGNPGYVFGDSINHILEEEGLNNYSHAIPQNMHDFIYRFDRHDLCDTHQALLTLVRNHNKKKYANGELYDNEAWGVIQKSLNMQKRGRGNEAVFPLAQEQGFELFSLIAPAFFVQNKEFLVDQSISSHDKEFRIALDSIHFLDDNLREVEIALSKSPTKQDYWTCYEINRQLSSLRKKVNEKREKLLFVFDIPPLQKIQESLAPNEAWITIMSDNIGDYIAVCDKNSFVIDTIPFRSGNQIMGQKPIILKNQLIDKIVNGRDWTSADQYKLGKLAKDCFGGRIPQNTEHIIISSDAGLNKAIIWDLLLREYMHNNARSLKSVRYSDGLLDKVKYQEEAPLPATELIAVGPEFKKRKLYLTNDKLLSLMDQLERADSTKYRYNFMPLMYNIPEVIAIGKLVKGKIMIGDEITEQTLLEQNLKGAVLHFATHSILDKKDPYRSGIVLNGSNFGSRHGTYDNILHFHEIRKLDLDAELVVLSACETGTSPKRLGGFQWTLANAFREAGCENIVSSSWRVDDRATHDIMIEFYKQLLQGKGKAEALFAAKEKYIKANPSKGPHFWAPLTLYGDNLPVGLVAR